MSMMNGMHNIRRVRVLYASGLIQAIFTSICVFFFSSLSMRSHC